MRTAGSSSEAAGLRYSMASEPISRTLLFSRGRWRVRSLTEEVRDESQNFYRRLRLGLGADQKWFGAVGAGLQRRSGKQSKLAAGQDVGRFRDRRPQREARRGEAPVPGGFKSANAFCRSFGAAAGRRGPATGTKRRGDLLGGGGTSHSAAWG